MKKGDKHQLSIDLKYDFPSLSDNKVTEVKRSIQDELSRILCTIQQREFLEGSGSEGSSKNSRRSDASR